MMEIEQKDEDYLKILTPDKEERSKTRRKLEEILEEQLNEDDLKQREEKLMESNKTLKVIRAVHILRNEAKDSDERKFKEILNYWSEETGMSRCKLLGLVQNGMF